MERGRKEKEGRDGRAEKRRKMRREEMHERVSSATRREEEGRDDQERSRKSERKEIREERKCDAKLCTKNAVMCEEEGNRVYQSTSQCSYILDEGFGGLAGTVDLTDEGAGVTAGVVAVMVTAVTNAAGTAMTAFASSWKVEMVESLCVEVILDSCRSARLEEARWRTGGAAFA